MIETQIDSSPLADTKNSSEHIWHEWRFSLHYNIKTKKLNSWGYTLSTEDDRGYRGGRPPKAVSDALNIYVDNGGYADLNPVAYLENLFGDSYGNYHPKYGW